MSSTTSVIVFTCCGALTENGTKGTNVQRGAEAMTGSAVCEAFLNLKSDQFIAPWEIIPEGLLNNPVFLEFAEITRCTLKHREATHLEP